MLGPLEARPLPIPHDCLDGFPGAYWRRPQAYLDPAVRGALSTFTNIGDVETGLASQSIAPVVVGAPCNSQAPYPPPFQTRVGRLFNLDHDVVVILAPLSTAGPGCSGNPNLALYVQDPHNPANNSQRSITGRHRGADRAGRREDAAWPDRAALRESTGPGHGRADAILNAGCVNRSAMIAELWTIIAASEETTLEQRARCRLAAVCAADNARDAMELMYRHGGSTSFERRLAECWRDLHVVGATVTLAPE